MTIFNKIDKKGCTRIKLKVITSILKPDFADAISALEGCAILRVE